MSMDDDHVTHNCITDYPMQNQPPLKVHRKTCPNCDGGGEMYGRRCPECNGKGLVHTPITTEPE
jgi:DnaJ-class molecular chaperone